MTLGIIIIVLLMLTVVGFRHWDDFARWRSRLSCKHEHCKVHPVPTKVYGLFAMFNTTCLRCKKEKLVFGSKELHMRMEHVLEDDNCDCSSCREIKAIMNGLKPMPQPTVD